MNYTDKVIKEINKMRRIARECIHHSLERWLNLAYKLDYIALFEKERTDALIRKLDLRKHGLAYEFTEANYKTVARMREIMSNTVLPTTKNANT